ncbi:MAG TPA: hypothetical protein VNX86_09080 [Rhizomicrobium sp.]|nr:hypothetical protein [Rhizomicrobium sp.]
MSAKPSDEIYSEAETARRRDAILRNMIATPPSPRKPKAKSKRKARDKRTKS